MAVEIVEGTLEPGQPQRNKRGYAFFPSLTIVNPQGERRTFAKVASGEPVTSEILRGGEGRFCISTSGGATGLVGVRRPDGSASFAYYHNLAAIVITVGILGLLCAIARFGFGLEDLPLTPAVLGPILLAAGAYMLSQKRAARQAFETDAA